MILNIMSRCWLAHYLLQKEKGIKVLLMFLWHAGYSTYATI